MDLKKTKKLKKKFHGFVMEEKKKVVGIHVYRAERRDVPFSKWERITVEPIKEGEEFTDEDGRRNNKFYFYKMTEIYADGSEGKPYDEPNQIEQQFPDHMLTPATTIMGMNFYYSDDPDIPLEQWTKLNEKPITDRKHVFKNPLLDKPTYIYSIYVNILGKEFGRRSDIQRIVTPA